MRTLKGVQGYGIVQTAAMKMEGLSMGAKATYAFLCSMTGNKEVCWPKQRTIAAALGVSVRTVKAYIRELVEKGLVVKGKRYPHGYTRLNTYEIRYLPSPSPGANPKGKRRSPCKKTPASPSMNSNRDEHDPAAGGGGQDPGPPETARRSGG